MDLDRDPITELREALLIRTTTWQPDRPPTHAFATPKLVIPRRLALLPRGVLERVRLSAAARRSMRSGRPIARAVAVLFGSMVRRAGRAGLTALSASRRTLVGAGRRSWSLAGASLATAARAQRHRRRRAAPEFRADAPPETAASDALEAVADHGDRRLEELERRQLAQRELALGPDHPDIVVLLQLVAERCAARGASEEATALYTRALRIQETAFGADSPALRPLLADLAELERELGRESEAIEYAVRHELLERRCAAPTDVVGAVVRDPRTDQLAATARDAG